MIETYLLYNFILIASTFFVYLYEKSEDPVLAKLMLCISFLIIFIPAALRYNIGTDYWSYAVIFDEIKNTGSSKTEIGYHWLNEFIIYLGLGVEWLFAAVAFITYFFLYLSYPKKNAALYHFLFITIFYLTTYTALRSAITFSISLIAINGYMRHRRLLPMCLWVAFGCLFHKSIALILFIPLLNTPPVMAFLRRNQVIILVFLVLIFTFRMNLIDYIFNSSLAESLGYARYGKNSLFSQPKELGTGLGVILRVIPLVLILVYAKKLIRENTQNTLIVIATIICTITVFLAISIDIFSRLERVYVFTYMLATMALFQSNTIKTKNILMVIILGAQLLLFENAINAKSWECGGARISPYVSIFNKYDDRSLQIPRTVCENY